MTDDERKIDFLLDKLSRQLNEVDTSDTTNLWLFNLAFETLDELKTATGYYDRAKDK